MKEIHQFLLIDIQQLFDIVIIYIVSFIVLSRWNKIFPTSATGSIQKSLQATFISNGKEINKLKCALSP